MHAERQRETDHLIIDDGAHQRRGELARQGLPADQLFADDERSLQELMKLELPRMGHTVTVCPDGLTAVAALEKNNYDCLLVDLDMPGLHGIEVIAKAKEMSPTTEAIVLTGKSSTDTAIAALRHGAFDYLTNHVDWWRSRRSCAACRTNGS